MHLAQVTFPFLRKPNDDAVEAATWVLSAWYKNGQVHEGPLLPAMTKTALTACVIIADADSLKPRHNNAYAQRELRALAGAGLGLPVVRTLGPIAGPSLPARASADQA